MTQDELLQKLHAIKNLGFVKTHRHHNTGIGKTLEDLLGITENNLRLPDLGTFELKAKRVGSNSMLTIATKSPQPGGSNKRLFEQCKYLDSEEKYNLHSTVYGSRINSQGFQLVVKDNSLVLQNQKNVEMYWPLSVFTDILVPKSNQIMLVLANATGKGADEQFHYIEAYLLSNLNYDRFLHSLQNDFLKVDIRMGVYRTGKNAGKFHDHGTAFRVFSKDYLQIFETVKRLL